MPNLIPGPTTSVEGFGITGRLGVTFREHRATFDAHIEMPDGVGGFDAQLRLTVTAEEPATLDELRISLPVGELQDTLPIDHLILDYEAAANRWLGDVGVSIGDYEVGAAVGFHTIPEAGLDQLRASLGGLNVSIYAGVFLQEIRFDYASGPPPELGGGITLSYGPEYYDRSLVSVDGDFHLALAEPVVIRIDGEGRILGFKVAAVQSRYSTDGNFSFDASVRVGVNPFGPPRAPWWEDSETPPFARLAGEVHGWIDAPHDTFNSSGAGEACFGGCFGATMLMSSAGVAGCAQLGLGSVGGGYAWVSRRFDWMAGACDLGTWTVARASRARAAQAERSLTLPAGLSVAAFKVTGDGAAPRVTVTGPRGERIVTPPGVNGEKTATSLVTLDPAAGVTYVAVGSPSAGTWRITADPGSAAITSASSARGAAPCLRVGAARRQGRPARAALPRQGDPRTGGRLRRAQRHADAPDRQGPRIARDAALLPRRRTGGQADDRRPGQPGRAAARGRHRGPLPRAQARAPRPPRQDRLQAPRPQHARQLAPVARAPARLRGPRPHDQPARGAVPRPGAPAEHRAPRHPPGRSRERHRHPAHRQAPIRPGAARGGQAAPQGALAAKRRGSARASRSRSADRHRLSRDGPGSSTAPERAGCRARDGRVLGMARMGRRRRGIGPVRVGPDDGARRTRRRRALLARGSPTGRKAPAVLVAARRGMRRLDGR